MGLGSAPVVSLSAAAVLVLAVWWLHQLRAERPLVDLRLVSSPRVGLSHVAALLTGFAFYANTLVTAQLVQAPEASDYGLGLSIVQTGLVLLPSGVVMLLLSPLSARISAARGPRITLALGAAVIAAGYGVRIADSRSLVMIMVGATVVSIGTTLAYSALPALILRAVPATQTASANGVNVLMRTVGQAVSSAAVAAVLVHHTSPVGGHPLPTLHGYLMAFGIAGTIALVACAVALLIPGGPAPRRGPPVRRMSGPSPTAPRWRKREHRHPTARRGTRAGRRDAEATKAAILRAARHLLARHAHADITLKAVAERAGVSPPLILKYFGNKDAVFAHVMSFDEDAAALLDAPLDDLGRHMVRHVLVSQRERGSDPLCGSRSRRCRATTATSCAPTSALRSPVGSPPACPDPTRGCAPNWPSPRWSASA